MKKTIALVAVLGFCVLFSGPVMGEELSIVGTGSGASILKALGSAFTKNAPDVTVDVPKSIGSGGGIKAVGTGEALIGRVARNIKEKEKHYGLSYLPLAKMPIVFFVHKGAGIGELSPQQVCGIYSGKITNWKEVGGKDARIRVIRREKGDSSLSVLLESFPGFKEITITPKSKTTYKDPDTCEMVQSKEGAIAFGPYANARNYSVQILGINGKQATDPDYPYAGTLALVFKEENKKGNVEKFLTFAVSSVARDSIKEAGGLPF